MLTEMSTHNEQHGQYSLIVDFGTGQVKDIVPTKSTYVVEWSLNPENMHYEMHVIKANNLGKEVITRLVSIDATMVITGALEWQHAIKHFGHEVGYRSGISYTEFKEAE